ncbi:hypothetical protein DOM22_03545 [Bdellovibrio sp. ZAP7]|nr:hypothetical protein DOM22_03545 [Bdellovibrio sp. ZAP7]
MDGVPKKAVQAGLQPLTTARNRIQKFKKERREDEWEALQERRAPDATLPSGKAAATVFLTDRSSSTCTFKLCIGRRSRF